METNFDTIKSKEIAHEFNKQHNVLMKTIRKCIRNLENDNLSISDYFIGVPTKNCGRMDYYIITKQGYEYLKEFIEKYSNLSKPRRKGYKWNIGEVIEFDNTRLEVLEHTRNNKKQDKMYTFKCLKCGQINEKTEEVLNRKVGCPVCSNKKVVTGINDISTTHPYMCRYFEDIRDAKNNTYGCRKKINMICPHCGTRKKLSPLDLYWQGFSCNQCGDGYSYPSKFIFNLLKQFDIPFQTELSKTTIKWCDKYKYDFYLPVLDMIIEVHGEQHYTNQFKGKKCDNLNNDKLKKELAIQNNITYYFEIDCRKSDKSYIMDSVIESGLLDILGIRQYDVDWEECHTRALSSKIFEVCELWNTGKYTTVQIQDELKINRSTVQRYLNKGHELGICNYDWKKRMINKNRNNGKKVSAYTSEKEHIKDFISTAHVERESVELFGFKLIASRVANSCRHNTPYKGIYFKYI